MSDEIKMLAATVQDQQDALRAVVEILGAMAEKMVDVQTRNDMLVDVVADMARSMEQIAAVDQAERELEAGILGN